MPAALALVLHAHQPVDNFDGVIQGAFESAYLPFLDRLQKRPRLALTLHFSGFLLDWIAARYPDYIARLRRMLDARQIELLGGGYYEPILSSLREPDRQAQLDRLSRRLAALFGLPPRGAWLAERVWQPDIAASLARAGLRYTVVDDTHFHLCGLPPSAAWRSCWTEFQEYRLQVAASDFFLRRAIPFLPEAQAIEYILAAPSRLAASSPSPGDAAALPPDPAPPLLVMGDDLEKFGSWPHTYAHVYRQGWLDRFFDRLDALQDRIQTVRLGDFLERYPPRRRIYMPAASYEEMMLWALPPAAALDLERVRDLESRRLSGPATQTPPGPEAQPCNSADAPDCRPFLTGAPWGNFLARYPEANHLHKRALDLSLRCEALARPGAAFPASLPAGEAAALLAEAREHLLAAQANDVYWHGLFGGIYSPHLRNAAYRHLLAAGRRLARLESPSAPWRRRDFELDGREQIELLSPQLRLQLDPAAGGVLAEIEYLPADANLTHSIARRFERYHQRIRHHLAARAITPGVESSPAALPDDGPLASALLYDRYARAGLRLYLFPPGPGWRQYRELQLQEDADWAAGEFLPSEPRVGAHAIELSLRREGLLNGRPLSAIKKLHLSRRRPELRLELALAPASSLAGWRCALEFTVNLLAPGASDRFLAAGDQCLPLAWSGELEGPELAWCDGWRNCRLRFHAPGALWWLYPIYTVSQSEAGVERVYQGSAAAAVWPADTAAGVINLTVDNLR